MESPEATSLQCNVIQLDYEEEKMETEEGDDSGKRKIKFCPQLSIIDIPSRASYSNEERMTLWMPSQDLKQLTQRNLVEFAAEGWFWKNVVEEDGMVMVDGNFIHPIHLNPHLKEALQRHIPYPRAVTPPDEDMLFQDAQMYFPEDPVDRPSSPFVETVFDQRYSSEEDDVLLREDPDAYLERRFAHHRRPREDLPYGDSDDLYVTQILYSDQAMRRNH